MPYSERLAKRVRGALEGRPELTEKKMFGGVCFLIRGNMCCGVMGDELVARVGQDGYEEALALQHVREMDFTGRPMRGMVMVAAPGIESEGDLTAWVGRVADFAASLPAR